MLDEQIGLLTLLKEFDSICRKHNITYYLEGGSLLGAVRHKGFLPWDDDIDLCITRSEWKKLLAVIDEDIARGGELADEVRAAVNEILARELENTIALIEANKPAVDALVEALLTKNHLSGDEIDAIFSAHAAK